MEESTITLEAGGSSVTMPTERFGPALREATAAVVAEHRHVQPTLSDDLFPATKARDVALVRLTIAGSVTLTRDQYESYLDGLKLGPGAIVEVRAAGYVVQPGAAWQRYKEDGEVTYQREGRVKIRLTDLGELSATGEEFDGE
jgi:hypothetical protein